MWSWHPRHLGFESLGKGVEILGALLSDRAYSACGFASEGIAATAKAIGDAALLCQNVKVIFLDMNLCANVRPTPIMRQVQARENPSLDLFPSVLSQENPLTSELRLELVEPLSSLCCHRGRRIK